MSEPMDNPNPTPPPAIRDESFVTRYSNNARFEATVYDLKIIFGESDRDILNGSEIIRQHTAITIPWPLARLTAYFLATNLAIHEARNGKITIPPSQVPSPLPTEAPPELAGDPNLETFLETVRELRAKLLGNL